jgi:uncharacterized protein YkwD
MCFGRPVGLLSVCLFLGGLCSQGLPGKPLISECESEALPPLQNSVESPPETALECELLSLTNQQRLRQGLHELTTDAVLTQIARDHSRGMAKQGFISHEKPSGNLPSRMERAGYLYEVVRENVASAGSIAKAQSLLIASSPHKRNILAGDVTRVGIGIVRHKPPFDKQLYVTQIFAAPRKEYRPSAVQKMLADQINEMRRRNGSDLIQPDPALEALAARSVSSLEMPIQKEAVRRMLEVSANELQKEGRVKLSRVDAAVQLLRNPKNISIPDHVKEKQARIFGTAVRPIQNSSNQNAFLVLTLIGYTR